MGKRRMLDYENQKIQNAQNSLIVIKQGLRVIESMANVYAQGPDKEFDIHRMLIPGETYLFLLAASQFARGIDHGEAKPFLLSAEKLEGIHKLRNIWEHRFEYEISGVDAFKGLHQHNKTWMKRTYSDNLSLIFKITHFPGVTKIAELIDVEEVIREAQEWHLLVYHEKFEENIR